MTTNNTNSSKFTLAKAAGATMFTLILVATSTPAEARSVYTPNGGDGRGTQGNNGHSTNRGGYGQGNAGGSGQGTNRGGYGQGNAGSNGGYSRGHGPTGNAGGYAGNGMSKGRPNSVTHITNNNTYVNRVSQQDLNRGRGPTPMSHSNGGTYVNHVSQSDLTRGRGPNSMGSDHRGPMSNGWGSDRRGPISSGYDRDHRGPISKGFDRDHRGPSSFGRGSDRIPPFKFAHHRIPDFQFRSHFGRDHGFRASRPLMMAGYRRFHHGGVTWGISRPWPAGWLATDYVYVDNFAGGYYLCNRRFPTVRIPVTVDACTTCVAPPPPVCTTCVAPPPPPVCDTCAPPVAVTPACDNCATPEVPVAQAECTDCAPQAAPALVRGQTISDVVSIMGAPQQTFYVGYKQIYLYPNMKVVFIGGRMVEAI